MNVTSGETEKKEDNRESLILRGEESRGVNEVAGVMWKEKRQSGLILPETLEKEVFGY